MSTPDATTPAAKRFTPAEIAALLDAEPDAVAQTCQQLCDALQSDADALQFIDVDFPANRRAAVRAATLRDMAALRAKLGQQHCPECF